MSISTMAERVKSIWRIAGRWATNSGPKETCSGPLPASPTSPGIPAR